MTKTRVRIGLSTSPRQAAAYYDNYSVALRDAGGEAMRLTPQWSALEGLHGLLLPGGWDLDPSSYGAGPDPNLGPIDPELDRAEIDLVRLARAAHLPVLGICRGQQVINVALGGTLLQHLPAHDVREHGWKHLAHDVRVRPETKLAEAVGADRVAVNSVHHQAVDRIAPGLVATATAPDGVIEGLESEDGGIVAVQFHAEELTGKAGWARTLFEAFVDRAASFGRREARRARGGRHLDDYGAHRRR